MSKEFTFNDLNKEMLKHSIYGETLDKSSISEIDHYISTGNYHLNACLTGSIFKGYPNNRSIALVGQSGVGKTYLLLNGIREAQQLGYYVVFYDSENAVDKALAESFGIDPTKIRYEPCNTVQEFRSSITVLTDMLLEQKKKGLELPKIMVVLDSAGNLATQKEIDDAKTGSDKADMTRAKVLKSTFRILITKMGILKIPFIFTNHTYQTLDLFSKEVQGGGTGPMYAASIILYLSKAKLKDGISQTGIIVTAKPEKNRFVKPIPIKFHISYTKGMNPYIGLENYISWDNCGIQRGKFINENAFNKLNEEQQKLCREHKVIKDDKENIIYFQPSDTARKICVAHLNDTVELNELYTDKVMTKEVLDKLNVIIEKTFSYGIDEPNISNLIDLDEDEN